MESRRHRRGRLKPTRRRRIARLRIDVEQCRLNGQCSQHWDTLEPVHDNPRVRYCSLCQSAVHLAASTLEMDRLVRLGKSVAVRREDLPDPGSSPQRD
jgi:hypothetical protein